MRPSVFNRPLPRLKPQPVRISRMILKRRGVKDRRVERLSRLQEDLATVQFEQAFEERLEREVKNTHQFSPVFGYSLESWSACSLFISS